MDSVTLTISTSQTVNLLKDNGYLTSPTTFSQQRNKKLGYGTVGTDAEEVDAVHYKTYTLGPGETIGLDMSGALGNPADGASGGGTIATLTMFQAEILPNSNGTQSESITFGGHGTAPVKLFFGDVSCTMTVKDFTLWASDAGVARGGTNLKITNADGSSSATFSLLLAGRST